MSAANIAASLRSTRFDVTRKPPFVTLGGILLYGWWLCASTGQDADVGVGYGQQQAGVNFVRLIQMADILTAATELT